MKVPNPVFQRYQFRLFSCEARIYAECEYVDGAFLMEQLGVGELPAPFRGREPAGSASEALDRPLR